MTAFGLLTAQTVDEIPKVLRRVALGYRGTQAPDEEVWKLIADDIDAFAIELNAKIKQWKEQHKPKRRRVRL